MLPSALPASSLCQQMQRRTDLSVLLGILSFPEVTCLWETKAEMLWRLGRQRDCLPHGDSGVQRQGSPASFWDGDATRQPWEGSVSQPPGRYLPW